MKTIYFKLIACFMGGFLHIQLQAQSWANYEKYEDQNKQLSKPLADENRVVFMGNSITEGWSIHDPSFFKDKPYINRGIGGQTTPQMLARFRPDVIELEPKVVVILAGTNDISGNTGPSTIQMIYDNIISMVELAKFHQIKAVICSVLPVYDYPWKPGLEPAPKIVELNNMLKKYAQNHSIAYADYWNSMADERMGLPKKYAPDEVHPNYEGYIVMGKIVEQAINTALNSP